jgi:hypothetical protein
MKYATFFLPIFILLLLSGCSLSNETSPEKTATKIACVIGNCINGKGQLNRYYQNKLFAIEEGIFVNGKLEGQGKKKYYTEEGSLDRVYKGGYKNGKLHGKMSYITYYNKQIASIETSTYIDGKEEGTFLYKSYQQGKLAYAQKGYYKQGKKNGIEISILYNEKGMQSNSIINHYVNGIKIEK